MKICITGTYSVGKTKLISSFVELYREYKYYLIPEVARDLIASGVLLGKNANAESYLHYINEQLGREIEATKKKFDILLADRSLIDAVAHPIVNRSLSDSIPQYIIDMFENILFFQKEFYDLYVYIPIEFSVTNDSVRSLDEAYRTSLDIKIKEALRRHEIDFHVVSGSVSERCRMLKSIIDAHRKLQAYNK